MLDDHTTPPDLKGKTLVAMYEERKANKPDPWTVAWLKARFEEITKGYLGASAHGQGPEDCSGNGN